MVAKLNKLFIFCICFFLFYSYLSSSMILFLGIGMLGVFLVARNKIFIVKGKAIPAFLSGVVTFLVALWSIDMLEAYTLGTVIIVFSFLKNIVIDKTFEYKKFIVKVMYFLSSVHVFATIFARFFPHIMLRINQQIHRPSTYDVISRLYNQKSYSGIAPQTGTDAYFIFVFLVISLFIFVKKKNIYTFSLNVLGICALLFTSKRATLLIYGLILFICLLYYLITNYKGTNKIIIKTIVVFLIILLIIYVISAFGYLFIEGDVDGISSGRWDLYTRMIEMYKAKPIFGNGFGYVSMMLGMHGHNIYLQLLCEFGILSCVFGVWFFQNLLGTYKILRKSTGERFLLNSISLCFQIYFILYGMFGNPIYDYFQLGIYIVFSSLVCKESEK